VFAFFFSLDLYNRCVTFEDMTNLTHESPVKIPGLRPQLESACDTISSYFHGLSVGDLNRCTLIFKLDDYKRLWLVWVVELVASSEEGDSNAMPFKESETKAYVKDKMSPLSGRKVEEGSADSSVGTSKSKSASSRRAFFPSSSPSPLQTELGSPKMSLSDGVFNNTFFFIDICFAV
jgi:hypothetical protein